MSDPAPHTLSPDDANAGARTVAELRLQLADRDRRLAELTEQSLQILDRLGQERAAHTGREEMYSRIAELQELLADTRQRIRLATRVVLGAGLEAKAGYEVVLWADAAIEPAQVDALLDAIPGVPVTVFVAAGTDAAPLARSRPAPLSIHETDCRTPAHWWNEALAATHAPVVVIVSLGTVPVANALARLAAAATADGVAAVSPVLAHAGQKFLGRVERSLLELAPSPVAGRSGIEVIPFASPEAFAISRPAFHQVGPFDQDLAGSMALAEWVLRATARHLRCLGVGDVEFTAQRLVGEDAASPIVESDRLVLLARHRPQQLAAAALAAQALWQQEPMAVAATLRAAFRRLPHANEFAAAVDLLVVQSQTVSGWKRLAPLLRDRLVAIGAEIGVVAGDPVSDPALVTLAERIQSSVVLARDRANDLEARCAQIPELHRQVAQCDANVREMKDEVIARSNVIDSLRHELTQREQAIAHLKQELGHRQGERDRLIDHLGHVQQELDRLQADVHDRQALSLQRAELERELDRESTRLQTVLLEIDQFRTGNENLRQEYGSLAERTSQLDERVRDLLTILRDREQWICALLAEVQRRRLRSRRLSPHEIEFLARHGIGPRS